MRLSPILSLYLARQFLIWCGIVFLSLAGLLLMFDVIELIRRTASRPDASFLIALEMALLKLSDTSQKCVPFAVLFGGLLAFWRLNRSHEFVVARAAGVSAWQFLLPALVCAALIGTFKIMVVNPLASVLLLRYDQMEAKYIEGRPSLLSVSSTGLWLRQADHRGQYIVHAIRVSPHDMEFSGVTVYLFEGTDRFAGRIDAPKAWLTAGSWFMRDARLISPNGNAEKFAEYRLATELTPVTIFDSFAAPETMSTSAVCCSGTNTCRVCVEPSANVYSSV